MKMTTRSISVKKGYYAEEKQNRSFHVGGYSSQMVNTSGLNRVPFGIKRVLSPEIDIFSALPQFVFENEHMLFCKQGFSCRRFDYYYNDGNHGARWCIPYKSE